MDVLEGPVLGQEAAVIPYVMLPTDSRAVGNDSLEYGVIVPWSVDIAAGTKAAAMVEWDELRNVANTRYDTRLYGSAFIKWDLGGRLGAYAEATLSDSTAGSATFAGTFGGGATLSISKDFQWDFEASRVLGSGPKRVGRGAPLPLEDTVRGPCGARRALRPPRSP
jgi:hypothetical protein